MTNYCRCHYRRNADEQIRGLARRAEQGDYYDIIRSLHARARTGDAWAQHQLVARTAFHALAELTRNTGLPQRHINDLGIIAADYLARYVPPLFGYILRDSGCHLMVPGEPRVNVLEDFDSLVRVFDHEGNIVQYYFWDGSRLSQETRESLRELLANSTEHPAMERWRREIGLLYGDYPAFLPPGARTDLRRELQRQEGFPVRIWAPPNSRQEYVE